MTFALDLISAVTATVEPLGDVYSAIRRSLKHYEIRHNDYGTEYKDYVLMTKMYSGCVELYFANSTGIPNSTIVFGKREPPSKLIQLIKALRLFFDLNKSFDGFSFERGNNVIRAFTDIFPDFSFDWGTNPRNFELRVSSASSRSGLVYGIQTGYQIILEDGVRLAADAGIRGTCGVMAKKIAGKWHVYAADKTVKDSRTGRSYPPCPYAGQEIRIKS